MELDVMLLPSYGIKEDWQPFVFNVSMVLSQFPKTSSTMAGITRTFGHDPPSTAPEPLHNKLATHSHRQSNGAEITNSAMTVRQIPIHIATLIGEIPGTTHPSASIYLFLRLTYQFPS